MISNFGQVGWFIHLLVAAFRSLDRLERKHQRDIDLTVFESPPTILTLFHASQLAIHEIRELVKELDAQSR